MSRGKKWAWILAGLGALIVISRVFGAVSDGEGNHSSTTSTTTAAAVAASTTTTSKPAATTTTAGVTRRGLLTRRWRQGLVEAEFRALGGASGDVAELDYPAPGR